MQPITILFWTSRTSQNGWGQKHETHWRVGKDLRGKWKAFSFTFAEGSFSILQTLESHLKMDLSLVRLKTSNTRFWWYPRTDGCCIPVLRLWKNFIKSVVVVQLNRDRVQPFWYWHMYKRCRTWIAMLCLPSCRLQFPCGYCWIIYFNLQSKTTDLDIHYLKYFWKGKWRFYLIFVCGMLTFQDLKIYLCDI